MFAASRALLAQMEKVIIKEGTGACPPIGSRVSVHYTGTFPESGKKFDSSVDRGQKFEFTLGRGEVIRCWDECVKNMKIGEKCVITAPSDLCYGSRGAAGVIPPNASLKFEIELFGFK